MHFLLDVVPLHGGIVPNCTILVLCQFVMEEEEEKKIICRKQQ